MLRVYPSPFRRIEILDRYRAFVLGLPVPIWYNKELPWGYDKDPENPDWAIPDDKALRALRIAHESLDDYSLADLAEWITQGTGRPLNKDVLRKLLKDRCPFKEIELPLEERKKVNGLLSTATAKASKEGHKEAS